MLIFGNSAYPHTSVLFFKSRLECQIIDNWNGIVTSWERLQCIPEMCSWHKELSFTCKTHNFFFQVYYVVQWHEQTANVKKIHHNTKKLAKICGFEVVCPFRNHMVS